MARNSQQVLAGLIERQWRAIVGEVLHHRLDRFPCELQTGPHPVDKRVARAAGFPDMRFHDLRHTSATLALAAGVHPKIVSERLGHSTIAITLDTYSHVLPNMQDAAAEALDAVIPQMPPSADAAS